MPYHAKRSCMHPGCQATYNGPGGYCEAHKASHSSGRTYSALNRDMERQAFETSARWRKIRHAYRAAHPLCHDCLEAGITTVGTEVHHIDNDWRNNDETNLMNLCTSCHSKRTRRGE